MEIMEVAKAFFLLKAANMREHSEKLGRATSTFEIKKMRKDYKDFETFGGALAVKEESCMGIVLELMTEVVVHVVVSGVQVIEEEFIEEWTKFKGSV